MNLNEVEITILYNGNRKRITLQDLYVLFEAKRKEEYSQYSQSFKPFLSSTHTDDPYADLYPIE